MSVDTRLQMRYTCDFNPDHQSNRNIRNEQTLAQRSELPEGWVMMRGPNGEELHFDTEACALAKVTEMVQARWLHFNPPAAEPVP